MVCAETPVKELESRRLKLDLVSALAFVLSGVAGGCMGIFQEGPMFIASIGVLVFMSYLWTYLLDLSHIETNRINDLLYLQEHGHARPKDTCPDSI